MKFKMKLGYECWRRNKILIELFREAIELSLYQKEALVVHEIREHLKNNEDFKAIERSSHDQVHVDYIKREKLARDYKQLRKEINRLEKERGVIKFGVNQPIEGLISFDDDYKELLKKYMFQRDIMNNHRLYVKKYIKQKGDSWDRIINIHAQKECLPLSMKFYMTMLATKANPGENKGNMSEPFS